MSKRDDNQLNTTNDSLEKDLIITDDATEKELLEETMNVSKNKQLIREIINVRSFIIIISFLHGLFDVSNLSVFVYQKNVLGLSPDIIQILTGVIRIPWCIKPILGFVTDKIIKRTRKVKYMVMVSSVIRIMLFSFLSYTSPGMFVFFTILTLNIICSLFENIVLEYSLVVETKKENEKKQIKTGNQLPIFFGFRAVGGLIGNFLGGRIIQHHSLQLTFFLCACIPVITLTVSYLYREEPVEIDQDDECHSRSFSDELNIMKKLIFRDNVFMLIVFVCLISMTPNFDMLITFYLTDYLHFTTEDLADFSSFATVCYIMSLLLYYFYLKHIDPKKFYIVTNFILFMFNLSFILVVLKVLDKWGISTKLFCLLSQGAWTFMAELNFMPILAIWCGICPKNLEATSITLFTGLLNLAANLSNYFGGFLIWLMDVHRTNYDDLWQPIVIQNSYLLFMMICITMVPFPDLTVKKELKPEINNKEGSTVHIDLKKDLFCTSDDPKSID